MRITAIEVVMLGIGVVVVMSMRNDSRREKQIEVDNVKARVHLMSLLPFS